jgi:hypothetical protein
MRATDIRRVDDHLPGAMAQRLPRAQGRALQEEA